MSLTHIDPKNVFGRDLTPNCVRPSYGLWYWNVGFIVLDVGGDGSEVGEFQKNKFKSEDSKSEIHTVKFLTCRI